MAGIHITVLGDENSGKTCLVKKLFGYTSDGHSGPSLCDTFEHEIDEFEKNMIFKISDLSGIYFQPEIRRCLMQRPDLLILCLNVVCTKSFYNIIAHWMNEITQYAPNTPILLVGTKIDLRQEGNDNHVQAYKGFAMAETIAAITYVECSSKQSSGIKEVLNILYDEASALLDKNEREPKNALEQAKEEKKKKKKKKCKENGRKVRVGKYERMK